MWVCGSFSGGLLVLGCVRDLDMIQRYMLVWASCAVTNNPPLALLSMNLRRRPLRPSTHRNIDAERVSGGSSATWGRGFERWVGCNICGKLLIRRWDDHSGAHQVINIAGYTLALRRGRTLSRRGKHNQRTRRQTGTFETTERSSELGASKI